MAHYIENGIVRSTQGDKDTINRLNGELTTLRATLARRESELAAVVDEVRAAIPFLLNHKPALEHAITNLETFAHSRDAALVAATEADRDAWRKACGDVEADADTRLAAAEGEREMLLEIAEEYRNHIGHIGLGVVIGGKCSKADDGCRKCQLNNLIANTQAAALAYVARIEEPLRAEIAELTRGLVLVVKEGDEDAEAIEAKDAQVARLREALEQARCGNRFCSVHGTDLHNNARAMTDRCVFADALATADNDAWLAGVKAKVREGCEAERAKHANPEWLVKCHDRLDEYGVPRQDAEDRTSVLADGPFCGLYRRIEMLRAKAADEATARCAKFLQDNGHGPLSVDLLLYFLRTPDAGEVGK